VRHQITKKLVPVGGANHRTGRYSQRDVCAAGSGLVRTPPVLPSLGPHQTTIVEVEEGVETFVDDEDHTPTTPTVTTIRPAPWDEFLASE
jgi:hypothetical protein